ncbi:SGNH/GDSL hydrolase family protein [Legionella shakespearei]|uniref:Putative thermolabile hemolysin n=1 Tax=Legionella shakespearei DSM 23087 TaxID=1122169 RepID=A0A0W0YLQ6_9GAMM|nr:SGNH/GDSL hydrolase family protein [Legionella shakespearei]KTD57810.1 putative thermolabile hemolysin [Legionella shakespearei DSM 23087]
MTKQKKISHIIMMGDSLSDRGTSDKTYVFGCIPMRWLAGLTNTSPRGRFTNGYVWADVIASFFANDFMIAQLKRKYNYSNDDIADAIVNKEKRILDQIMYDYNLNNDLFVKYEGHDFIRSYDQGGLSSYDYSWSLSSSITRFISRIILPTLKTMRDRILAYDKKNKLSDARKRETLIIEWSGANDLITVNAKPSIDEVNKAVKERVKNVEILLKHGYRNFVWFNLPDLSLTPRFQNMAGAKGDEARNNAHDCIEYFNQELANACEKLKVMYPHCNFDLFDINSVFVDAYQHPEKYGLDSAKLKKAYTTSDDFQMLPNGTSPAKGYAFWDDIHPTANVHAVLANKFYEKYNIEYKFTEPGIKEETCDISKADLEKAFRVRYEMKLAKEKSKFFGSREKPGIDYKNSCLEDLLKYALYGHAKIAHEVLVDLQWIDEADNAKLNIPILKKTIDTVRTEHDNPPILAKAQLS